MIGRRRKRYLKQFEAAVRAEIEPVVREAGFQWHPRALGSQRKEVYALFEADPPSFARRFPGISRGPFPPDWLCIDLWIYFYWPTGEIWGNVHGKDVADWLREHGHESLADRVDAPTDLQDAVRRLAEGLAMMFSLTAAREG